MPTVWSERGFLFMIHTNDHEPVHVHAYKSGGVVLIDVRDLSVRKVIKMKKTDVKLAEPRAQSVHFDRGSKRLKIELQDGVAMMIPAASIQGLGNATAKEIEAVELLAEGYALHWPALDVDVTVPGLVSGIFGTKQWMRQMAVSFLAEAGRKGGKARTPVKRVASRANGKLGGRPRKKVVA